MSCLGIDNLYDATVYLNRLRSDLAIATEIECLPSACQFNSKLSYLFLAAENTLSALMVFGGGTVSDQILEDYCRCSNASGDEEEVFAAFFDGDDPMFFFDGDEPMDFIDIL